MTDREIISAIQSILQHMHQHDVGVYDYPVGLNADELEIAKKEKQREIAEEKGVLVHDASFVLSGKEIAERRLGCITGCTGLAKTFMYLARDTELDLKAVITTRIDSLETGMNGHVVPAVKLSDGQYHMFDPQRPDLKFLERTAEVGATVHHTLSRLADKDYKVMKIIRPLELEQIKKMSQIVNASREFRESEGRS